MIKKGISFSFILIAMLIIMAHDVIPHHHSHDAICAEQHLGDATSPNHVEVQHPLCCELNDEINLISNSSAQCRLFPDHHHHHRASGEPGYFIMAQLNWIDKQFDYLGEFGNPPQLIFLPSFLKSSLSLRAPPIS